MVQASEKVLEVNFGSIFFTSGEVIAYMEEQYEHSKLARDLYESIHWSGKVNYKELKKLKKKMALEYLGRY